ncbi:MAG: hypothetical protein Q4G23_11105, partial [Clostridia bacterium]|nr:hypothetical protein [Clostridia bacterium]
KAEAAAKRAEEAAERAEEAAKVAGAEEETTTGSVEFEYTGWGGFTRNIDKMGLGMLGIFVVIGIIVIVTSLLNKIKNKD